MQLDHIVKISPGYNCKDFKCKFKNSGCNKGTTGYHGIHGCNMYFIVKGSKGAVNFTIFTGWVPKLQTKYGWGDNIPLVAADLGFHSYTPKYAGDTPNRTECEWLDNKPCYGDGIIACAELAMVTLVNGGDEELWKFLEQYYMHCFEDGEMPKAFAYPTERR